MKNLVLLLAITIIPFSIEAQSKQNRADDYFADFKFQKAITLYNDLATEKRRPSLQVVQRLADSHFNINEYREASKWYSRLYDVQGNRIGENNIIKLVQCLKADNRTDEADALLKDFYSDRTRLAMILAQKGQLDSMSEKLPEYSLMNMPFNSKKSDFAPAIYHDALVFASTRDTLKANGKLYPWNNQPYLDLYITEPSKPGFVPEKFLGKLESLYHDANLAFSPNSQTVYFTRNYLRKGKLSANEDGLSNMQILKATMVMNELTNVSSLNFNSEEYSCGHPAVSDDGRWLYFTSDMPGGYGESDLYVVELSPEGDAFTPPINLGNTINTPGREMFPFVYNEALYFSSDSHYGFGGLDIFVSRIFSRSEYSLPRNLGKPFNSNMDDFSFTKHREKGGGFLASNRFGGVGDDDIYYFEEKRESDCLEYSGFVRDEKTGEPIADASVEHYIKEEGLVSFTRTDINGYYKLTLPCDKEHRLVFTKPGHSKKTVKVVTRNQVEEPSVDNVVYLTPFNRLVVKEGKIEKIIVNPIYFDYDKSNITPRAEIELDKVLFAMREFPDIKIKIESHTDSRGTDSYNLKLSDDRAKSTKSYLVLKGIAENRILSAAGYGEKRLLNECSNGTKCTENEHLFNRRSDFIIVR